MDLNVQTVKRFLKSNWDRGNSLIRFHPPERFINSFVGRWNTLVGKWRPLSLPLAPRLEQQVFHFYCRGSDGAREVIKIPRGDQEPSYRFLRALKDNGAFAEYRRTLLNLKSAPLLGEHCVQVSLVRRDGGYSSNLVDGTNVAAIRDRLLGENACPDLDRTAFHAALGRLLDHLKSYHERHGRILGDWALHNLVYSPRDSTIVNVDAKSFCRLPGISTLEVNQFSSVAANILDLVDLVQLTTHPSPADAPVIATLRVLDEVRRTAGPYSGVYFMAGYHSLVLKGRLFRGQRQCQERLRNVPYDFANKVVLDIGCNCGGMLHALADKIGKGFGLDFDPHCINAAQAVKLLNERANLQFYTFDLDRQDLSLIRCLLLGEKVDICFLLAVCMWVERWRSVIAEVARLSKVLLFESNGTPLEQDEQIKELKKHYRQVDLLSDSSVDDPLYGNRKLFLCRVDERDAEVSNRT